MRGIAGEAERGEFLSPSPQLTYDPQLLRGLPEAVDLICAAVAMEEKIAVYGDYDADGVTSSVILKTILAAMGAKDVVVYIPSRFDEGYGLNEGAVRRLAEAGVQLIVTVDCGSVSFREVQLAQELGMEVVVTDHHNCDGGVADTVVVNPKQADCPYPGKGLAGCGVAFKLALALRDAMDLPKYITNELLDLVAIGTVADVVPLIGENRTLVKYGLRKINQGLRPGLAELVECIYRRKDDLSRAPIPVDASRIAFGIGPHLNAAGRMGDASLGVRLLLAATREEAAPLAARLHSLNEERRTVQERTEKDCLLRQKEPLEHDLFPILLAEDSHEGTNGIVAGRLRERYHKPVAILSPATDGMYKGTSRSTRRIDLYRLLATQKPLFASFGGHAMACGFTVSAENVEPLRRGVNEVLAAMAEADPALLRDETPYDMEVRLEELTQEAVEELALLEPCGKDNERPAFLLRSVHVDGARIVGSGRALQCGVSQGGMRLRAVRFGGEEEIEALEKSVTNRATCDMIATVDIHDFRGERTVELRIREVR